MAKKTGSNRTAPATRRAKPDAGNRRARRTRVGEAAAGVEAIAAVAIEPAGADPTAAPAPITPVDAGRGDSFLASEVEHLLCAPAAVGAIDALLPRRDDAWSMQLRGLESLADPDEPIRPIRICIAAEQITGPVRNGGIGTTYAALAILLAEAGFDVTILYLRGQESEIETIEYWIADYAAKGVKLVPVPDYATAERFASQADRWLRAPYNMMRWLIDNPMDVVHVSEWRGSGWLSLLAKRQGLALGDTLFVVKTSSPWMWNRLYGSNLLQRVDDLVKIQAERQSVELADVVIGGSLHLLRWMASQGYAVPHERAFVQPNVVTFETLQPLIERRALPHGERTEIDEFVFFGRLEARKGLFVFCQAIRRMIRRGVTLPPRITFMGKPGARLPSHPDQDTPDFIQEISHDWPTEVQIISSYQQYEAIEYLLGGKRLAVMPSIIENSSMAIYEAAICAIPTVATNVGGNAELIDAADHSAVLCAPHPVALGDKLEEALAIGGMVPRPSFDNDANLETWRRFHRQLAGPLHARLLAGTRPPSPASEPAGDSTSVCIYFQGDGEALEATLASLAGQVPRVPEVVIAVDAASLADVATATHALERHGLTGEVIEAFDLDVGAAGNAMAANAGSRYLLFAWEGATLRPDAIATLAAASRTSAAEVLTFMVREVDGEAGEPGVLRAPVIAGPSDAFFRADLAELPVFVARSTFAALGGFTTDYRVIGHDHEFVARAQLANLPCQTVMRELGTIRRRGADWWRQRGYDLAASEFRLIRPELAGTPLALRDTLLLARGQHDRMRARGKGGSDVGATPEGVLMRIIAGMPGDEAAPRKTKTKAPSAKQAVNATVARPAKAGSTPRARLDPPRQTATRRAAATKAMLKDTRRLAKSVAKAPRKTDPALDRLEAGLEAELRAAGTAGTARTKPVRPLATGKLPGRKPAMSAQLRALVARGEAAAENARVGQLLGVFEGRAYGWTAQLGQVGSEQVELIVDGARGQREPQPADRFFAPFAVLPPEAARCGFVIDLPKVPARSIGAPAYAVVVAGHGLVIGEGLVLPRGATLDIGGLDGRCTDSSDGIVQGWLRHGSDPGRTLDVALFVNGALMGRMRADLPVAEGACGFAVPVPRVFRDAGRHRIDVVVAHLGIPLPGSPVWVEGARVTTQQPTPKRKPRK